MRKVEIFTYKPNEATGLSILVSTGETGVFHKFGVNYEDFESGPGPYTSAIVEMPDGKVRNLSVEMIRFLT